MAERREESYPLTCPICSVSMIGEKSDREDEYFHTHRCLNCGLVMTKRAKAESDNEDQGI